MAHLSLIRFPDFENLDLVKITDIMKLAARGRVERRAIKLYVVTPFLGSSLDYGPFKGEEIRVFIIQAFGHEDTPGGRIAVGVRLVRLKVGFMLHFSYTDTGARIILHAKPGRGGSGHCVFQASYPLYAYDY